MEGLKTQVKRKFPLNSQVNQILESIKPEVINLMNLYLSLMKETSLTQETF